MKPILNVALLLALGASTALQAGSALTKAAAGGDLTGIHSALKAGEGINDLDSNGWTALMWAVYYRQAPAAELLLEKGANPDLQSNDSRKSYPKGTTALLIAANDCQEDLAVALVRKNARKDLADANGKTAEIIARANDCSGVLRAMGFKAAANRELDALLKEIEGGKDINALDASGWTPLMWAVYYGDLPTTELLLQKGADPNIHASERRKPYEKGATALIIAGYGGLDDQVETLLKKKANPALVDATGKTAADHARINRYTTTLGVLGIAADPGLASVLNEIKAGKKSVNALGDCGWTPLMSAVFYQDLLATKTLLDLGADPNVQSTAPSPLQIARQTVPKGSSALMIAARLDKGELAALLLQKGANPRLTDDSCNTAEFYAITGDFWSIQDALLDRSPLKKSFSHLAVAEFSGAKRGNASQCREKVLAALSELKGFDKIETAVEGKKYEPSTLLLKVEFTKLELPVFFGSPNAKFTVRLEDASTGNLERKQTFSLVTDSWSSDRSERESAFIKGMGSAIAEYALLATGKALPCEEAPGQEKPSSSSFGFAAGPVFVRIENRQPNYWQFVEQLPTYPTYRQEDFTFAALRTQRIAVWPLTFAELDPSIEQNILAEYGTQDKFLAALSQKFSARWLGLASVESLGTDAIRASLGEGESKTWLDSRRILPWANSRLLAKNQLGSGFDALVRHPRLQGIRYLILPHHLRSARIVVQTGVAGPTMMPMSSASTHSSLGVAIIDLPQGRVVWNGAFTASASSNWMRGTALHENEDQLLEALEKEVRGGK